MELNGNAVAISVIVVNILATVIVILWSTHREAKYKMKDFERRLRDVEERNKK